MSHFKKKPHCLKWNKTYTHGASNALPLAYTIVSLPGMEVEPKPSHVSRVAHPGQTLDWNSDHTKT